MDKNILIITKLYDWKDEKNLLKKSKKGLSGAENRFQWAIIKGIEYNLKKDLSRINIIPLGAFPNNGNQLLFKNKIIKNTSDVIDISIGFLNLPLIKKLIQCLKIVKYTNQWYKKNLKNKNILVYGATLENLAAISRIKRKHSDVEITLIVTDMPEFYEEKCEKFNILDFVKKKINERTYEYMKYVDKFVILTEYMKDKLNIADRDYVVIEGIAEKADMKDTEIIQNKKIILYSGALDTRYKIIDLIEGFMKINNPNYELWICGDGKAKIEIQKKLDLDKRIKYFGYVTKDVMDDLQNKATILVNPRPNKGEYTKYSFPSKILEYLMKGKPILCHKLDGVPDEYDKYLNYFKDESIDGIKMSLIQLCEKDPDELKGLGKEGRNFAISKKNHIVQSKKIIDLIN